MRSATGFSGSGSRDWIVQRLSAVILAVYVLVLLGWMVAHPGFDYDAWVGFMKGSYMKVFSMLAILSLAGHAWVGVWTILTDYVKSFGVRIVLELATIVAVIGFTIWGIQIFWG